MNHIEISVNIVYTRKRELSLLTMTSAREISVMGAFKPFFRALTIYTVENFKNQDQRALRRNICHAIALSILCISYIVAMLANAWHCLTEDFVIAELATPLGMVVFANQAVSHLRSDSK